MTSALTPEREWWTAVDLADTGLPGVPGTMRGVNLLAQRRQWRRAAGLVRRRKGGGWEYHWTLLSKAAQQKLLSDAIAPPPAPPSADRDEAWTIFEAAPDGPRAKAAARLRILQMVEQLTDARMTKDDAIAFVAEREGVGLRTVWGWFALVEGIRSDDRLAYLLPRRPARRTARRASIDPEFGALVKSDYLRPEQPTLKACYDRAVSALGREVEVPGYKAVQRWLKREVSAPTLILARQGAEALKRMYPPQQRDKTALTAMEAVNGDVHRFDVFVQWPARPGEKTGQIARPQMVAFQDVHSGKMLSWRVDRTPNAQAVKLAIGDMIETWGIPQHVLLDNGREFAAKELTGGAPTRYRFKVREDDLPGLFVQLGCEIHWATPYSGQSKPIERAFRDLCDRVSKDPRFSGAYTGNRVDAKPENYASRAIPLEDFLAVLAEGIDAHNARPGRRSEVAYGRSFDEVFAESYAAAPVRKATEAQRRLWLMGAEGLRGDAVTGHLTLMGNRYWQPWAHELRGRRVIGRFDPAGLWDGLHVYDEAGGYLGHLECQQKTGFFDVDDARLHAKARRDWLNAARKERDAHRRFEAAEVGDVLDALAPELAAPVEAKVVRAVFEKRERPEPAPQDDAALAATHAAIVADLDARRAAPAEAEEDERERFRRALQLERAVEAGEDVTKEQAAWLGRYQNTPEYRANRILFEDFGERMFLGGGGTAGG